MTSRIALSEEEWRAVVAVLTLRMNALIAARAEYAANAGADPEILRLADIICSIEEGIPFGFPELMLSSDDGGQAADDAPPAGDTDRVTRGGVHGAHWPSAAA